MNRTRPANVFSWLPRPPAYTSTSACKEEVCGMYLVWHSNLPPINRNIPSQLSCSGMQVLRMPTHDFFAFRPSDKVHFVGSGAELAFCTAIEYSSHVSSYIHVEPVCLSYRSSLQRIASSPSNAPPTLPSHPPPSPLPKDYHLRIRPGDPPLRSYATPTSRPACLESWFLSKVRYLPSLVNC